MLKTSVGRNVIGTRSSGKPFLHLNSHERKVHKQEQLSLFFHCHVQPRNISVHYLYICPYGHLEYFISLEVQVRLS